MKTIHMKHALRGPWLMDGKEQMGPVPPGVLHGDRWCPETGAIERGAHGPIVGIVDFTAKTRYGFSSRGVPQYLFHPADPRFPPMIVGSKAAVAVNQWGVISTKGLVWSTTKSRWPTVQLQELLGPVGMPEVEAEVLRLRYLRPVPRSKSAVHGAFVGADPVAVRSPQHWDAVFNIDPAGCRDVDDILAWRRVEGGIEFGVGIADVAALVPKGSALDSEALMRAQTLYRDGVAIEPMLPKAISEGAGSLLADGKARGVVMASWRLEEADGVWGNVQGPVWSRTTIVNQRSYTYESVLADSTISNILPQYLAAITGLSVAEVGADSHRWVELAMVTYNRAAADQVATTGILRRHRGITAAEYQDLAVKTGCTELAFLGYAAGEYVQAGGGVVGLDTVHAGLGVERYAHASSPLRRYADLVNQRILVGMLEAEDVRGIAEAGTAAWLNERAKEARAYEREAWCLSQLSAKELREAPGWVLGWTTIPNTPPEVRLRVYVPEWKRQVKVVVALLGEEEGGLRVGNRGVGVGATASDWIVQKATPVRITAFWDLRGTPEQRFVFRVAPAAPAAPTEASAV